MAVKDNHKKTKVKKMGKILVEHGKRADLAKLFKVSERSVYNALNEVWTSDLAGRIRKAAIENGGVEQKIIKHQ